MHSLSYSNATSLLRRKRYRQGLKNGFTLVEILVTAVLLVVLATSVLGSITAMHKMVRSQATYNSVMALIMSEQEAIRTQPYSPPTAPFTASTTKSVQRKSVSLNPDGTAFMVDVELLTVIEPLSNGHKVTVSGTYAVGGSKPTITTNTVVNKFSRVDI